MKTEKQLIVLITLMVGLVSYLTGYLYTRSSTSLEPSWQKANILERFSDDQPKESVSAYPKGVFKISNGMVLDPVISNSEEKVRFYDQNLNKIDEFNLITKEQKVLKELGANISQLFWSPNQKEVIYSTHTSKGNSYQYTNLESNKTANLGLISSPVFSPDGNSVAFLNIHGDISDVIIAQPDGKASKTLLKTRLGNAVLYWPKPDMVVLKAINQSTDQYELYSISQEGDLKKLYENAAPFELTWAPQGNQALMVVKGGLILFNMETKTTVSLPIQTSASNCAWAQDNSLVCSAAQSGETHIYRVGIGDQPKEIANHILINSEKLLLSSLKDFVIMVSKDDHHLYGLELLE
ncbi:hypothetical protein KW791_00685 [Candidatus Parcubacteria bacterium]|nr:hypothetical protein [Candidatus Parcubacteria bacterium]